MSTTQDNNHHQERDAEPMSAAEAAEQLRQVEAETKKLDAAGYVLVLQMNASLSIVLVTSLLDYLQHPGVAQRPAAALNKAIVTFMTEQFREHSPYLHKLLEDCAEGTRPLYV